MEELNKAHNLIINLINEIVNSNNPDKIANIRKKLNYYINKIKREMIKRQLDEEKISKYSEEVKTIRNHISKYIRFLKRQEKIEEIKKLSKNYQELSSDEQKIMQKMISLELKYNKYYTKDVKITEVNIDNELIEDKEPADDIKDLVGELERVYLVDYDNLELVKNKNTDSIEKIDDIKSEEKSKKLEEEQIEKEDIQIKIINESELNIDRNSSIKFKKANEIQTISDR